MSTSPKTFGKLFILLAGLTLTGIILLLFGADSQVNQENISYIQGFGWQVEETPEEISHLTIPTVFNSVFTAYNTALKHSGFDLTPYQGVRATRYTYRVLNHKESDSQHVKIQVFVTKKGIIAAHICSFKSNGFFLPINDTSGQI